MANIAETGRLKATDESRTFGLKEGDRSVVVKIVAKSEAPIDRALADEMVSLQQQILNILGEESSNPHSIFLLIDGSGLTMGVNTARDTELSLVSNFLKLLPGFEQQILYGTYMNDKGKERPTAAVTIASLFESLLSLVGKAPENLTVVKKEEEALAVMKKKIAEKK